MTRLLLGFFLLSVSNIAYAQALGSELMTGMTPVNGAMAGTSGVRGHDAIARLFGNPATMSQIKSDTEVLLGAAYVSPDLELQGDVLTPGGLLPVDGNSTTQTLLLPHGGVIQNLDFVLPGLTAGFGFTGLSGLGSDWRTTLPQPFGLTADLKIFGAAMNLSYEVTDNLTLGASFIGGIGSLAVGTISSSSVVNDFGFAFNLGGTYEMGPIIIGGNWRTKMRVTYDNVIRPSPGELQDFTLTQPNSFVVGAATSDKFSEKLVLQGEYRWIDYSDASGYQAFWRSIWSVAFGASYEVLPGIPVRLGFSANRKIAVPGEELGNSFGNLNTLFAPGFPDVGFGQDTAPVSPGLLQLVQATIADGNWTRGVTAGTGIQLTDTIRFDVSGIFGFRGDKTFQIDSAPGQVLNADGKLYSIGFGFTWAFGDPRA